MNGPVLIEVCVDSVTSALAAEQGGADRVELCSDLLEGGVTPSAGFIEAVRHRIALPLHVMIRPRGGDFCYSDEEIEIMCRDIERAKSLGANGVVLGILDSSGRVNVGSTRKLVDLARPLAVTVHRSFDMSIDLFQALEDVCATGADRVLTSGGEQTSLQGVETIAALVNSSAGRIAIMAGSGIISGNACVIIERTGVREIHVGLGTSEPSPMLYQNSRVSMGKASGREFVRSRVREEDVRSLREAITPT